MRDESSGSVSTSSESNHSAPASSQAAASMSPIEHGSPKILADNGELDDQGTSPKDAVEVLRRLRDDAFDANNEQLALALGRPVAEIEDWLGGAATIDGDVLMKARGLASARGLNLE
jgi:hypothetical protein